MNDRKGRIREILGDAIGALCLAAMFIAALYSPLFL